jgi:hypothetical protein
MGIVQNKNENQKNSVLARTILPKIISSFAKKLNQNYSVALIIEKIEKN